MSSLKDQLVKAGLVDEKKAKAAEKAKRKQARKVPKGQAVSDENKEQVRLAQREKTERDRQLNRERQEAAEQKAIAAQIRQLIDMNRIDRTGGEIAYNFADAKKIRKLYVTDLLQQQLINGVIAVVASKDNANDQLKYELVPKIVAEKIKQRDASVVLVLNVAEKQADAAEDSDDDFYADYKIPDDLMW